MEKKLVLKKDKVKKKIVKVKKTNDEKHTL